jgi:hypothetical protein
MLASDAAARRPAAAETPKDPIHVVERKVQTLPRVRGDYCSAADV